MTARMVKVAAGVARGLLPIAAAALCAVPAFAADAQHAVKVADNVYKNIYGIAVDKHGIYVTGSTAAIRDYDGAPAAGVVGILPLAGGAVTTLYSSSNYAGVSGHVTPLQIATDGDGHLTWSDPDAGSSTGSGILTGDYQGSAPALVLNTCCGPGAFPGDVVGAAVGGGISYFSDATGGGIGKLTASGPAQIGDNRYQPDFSTEMWSQIAVSKRRVFLADSGESIGAASGVQAVTDRSASAGSGIRVLYSDDSTTILDLATDVPNPHGLVVVDKYVYFTTAKAVWKVKISTGKVSRVAADRHFVDLQGIAYYDGFLYVADDQNTYGDPVNGVATATRDKPGVVWKVTP